ncbi:MAG TPA: SDR family oxidoreductase [Thermoleophilaceae bacterium]|nr:SDR family oxidoreductase [Thermoleophilaceae bacterium]
MARSHSVQGKTVLITGAARGIGAETARRLAARGARLSLVGLEPDMLERVAAECGEAIWCEADVTDRDALAAAVDSTVDRFGGIDVVMANAGIGAGGTVRTMDPDGWERVIEVNLLGVYRTIGACLPHVIERRGYVLPVSSMASSVHSPGMSAYAAAKSAVEALGNSLRMEVRHLGVDVGVAYYSWIDTEMVRGADARAGLGEWRKRLRGPAGKTFTVEEAGEATAAGIEARARRIVVPKSFNAVLFGRMLVQRLGELQMKREAPRLLEEMEATAREDPTASQPVGAGGAADSRTRSSA